MDVENESIVQFFDSGLLSESEHPYITGSSHNFVVTMQQPLMLDGDYTVGLQSATIPYSSYNISAAYQNNTIKMSCSGTGAGEYYTIVLEDGSYSLDDINAYLVNFQKATDGFTDGNGDPYITLAGQNATGKVLLRIRQPIVDEVKTFLMYVIFPTTNGMGELLGFPNDDGEVYGDEENNYGPDRANISNSINFYLINCSLVTSGYNGVQTAQVLQRVPLVTTPGNIFFFQPINIVWLKCKIKNIMSVRFWITDELGRDVDLHGETVSYTLEFKKKNDPNAGLAAFKNTMRTLLAE